MADIELIVKIPEEVRVAITRMGLLRIPNEMQKKVDRAIQRGTPLPKGHGRIGDLDVLNNGLREQQRSYEHTIDIRQPINEAVRDGIIIARSHIDHALTIIEADKESEVEE